MQIKDLKVPNSRLVEGSYHNFEILKTVELVADEPYFILKDPFGYKLMMPAAFYLRYGFKNGDIITCRIDRVNCNGRMFIEPMHPVYQEEEIYNFNIVNRFSRSGLTGKPEFCFRVEDVLGYRWDVVVGKKKFNQYKDRTLDCRLERVKKGILFLHPVIGEPHLYELQKGSEYNLKVAGEIAVPETKNHFWVLEHPNSELYPLNKKHYSHYGIKSGTLLKCRVTGFTLDGYYNLEPENPWYKLGQVYEFNTLEINRLTYLNGTVEHVLVLDDPFNEPFKMFIEEDVVNRVKSEKRVKCVVQNIRKSRLETKLI